MIAAYVTTTVHRYRYTPLAAQATPDGARVARAGRGLGKNIRVGGWGRVHPSPINCRLIETRLDGWRVDVESLKIFRGFRFICKVFWIITP